jgi:hypothetical protein
MEKGKFTDDFLKTLRPLGSNRTFQDSNGLYITASFVFCTITQDDKIILRWRAICSIKQRMMNVSLLTYPLVSIDVARFGRDIAKAYAKKGIDPREKLLDIYGAMRDFREGKTPSARDYIYHNNL